MALADDKTISTPTTRYPHVNAALEEIATLEWQPVDDTELARILKAHARALHSAEIEGSFQEPDEIAMSKALGEMRAPTDIRKKAILAFFKHMPKRS